ncbi:hypothetical protein WDU94_004796 [Cyamophila willieti]
MKWIFIFGLVVSQTRRCSNSLISLVSCWSYHNQDGSCPADDVSLWFYSTYNRQGIQITHANMSLLPVIPHAPWKILFHGFLESKDGSFNAELRKAYFAFSNYNIISVHAPKAFMSNGFFPTDVLCYETAASVNLDLVGRCVAEQLGRLILAQVIPTPERLHFVGHSLGAHAAADASVRLRLQGLGTIYRLTGLDPAGPSFHKNSKDPLLMIDPSDATFIDAYHTNGGETDTAFPDVTKLDDFRFGIGYNVGTVDIWFNGGTIQPGCFTAVVRNICSHMQAINYYAESIQFQSNFFGYSESGNPVLLGEHMSTALRGVFNVTTHFNP